jgi:hypothetical protein
MYVFVKDFFSVRPNVRYMHVCMYKRSIRFYAYMYIYILLYTFVCIYMCVYVYLCVCVCMLPCLHMKWHWRMALWFPFSAFHAHNIWLYTDIIHVFILMYVCMYVCYLACIWSDIEEWVHDFGLYTRSSRLYVCKQMFMHIYSCMRVLMFVYVYVCYLACIWSDIEKWVHDFGLFTRSSRF